MNVPRAEPTFERFARAFQRAPVHQLGGRVAQVVGLVIEADGPSARLGDLCWIETEPRRRLPAEVVGFRGHRTLLMPLGEMQGVRPGCLVLAGGARLSVPAGPEMLGRVIDALGEPVDLAGPISAHDRAPLENCAPPAMERQMIVHAFPTGVRAIDSVLTMGIGQRVGIFAGSGVGKSTLLGMIARNCQADVNIICLVGERGREVREFMEHDLGDALSRSIVVVATSDEPALKRIKAAFTATALAEYFRDKGLNVLLMMDSVTRFAMAQREVGLAVGEPPSTKGYTPSVFALLPRLMERAGCGPTGAITAIYTVLVDGDDTNEPIADATRSILDGHIVLSRKLTSRGHYPPIDVLASLSRVMPMVTSSDHVQQAAQVREWVAAHHDIEDLVSIGAYKPGSKPTSDAALARWEGINALLRQPKADKATFEDSISQLQAVTRA